MAGRHRLCRLLTARGEQPVLPFADGARSAHQAAPPAGHSYPFPIVSRSVYRRPAAVGLSSSVNNRPSLGEGQFLETSTCDTRGVNHALYFSGNRATMA